VGLDLQNRGGELGLITNLQGLTKNGHVIGLYRIHIEAKRCKWYGSVSIPHLKIAGWTINTFHGAMDRCTTTTSSSTVVSCTQVDDAVVPWLYVDDAVSTSCVEASGLLRIYATNTSTKKLL
jgi:hypothetical protein